MSDVKDIIKKAVDDLDHDLDVDSLQYPKQKKFLKHLLISGGNIKQASEQAGQHISQHYKWKKDPHYMKVFDNVIKQSTDILEAEAIRRAIQGEVEEVYFEGEVVGHRLKKSDVLLMFLLKERKPSFKDNYNPSLFNTGNFKIEFNIPRPPEITNVIDVECEE